MYARSMSVMNRRNAMLGWATWTVFRQFLKRKTKAEAVEVEEPRRFRRKRTEPVVEPPKKKHNKFRALAVLSATAVGVGIWLRGRGRGTDSVE